MLPRATEEKFQQSVLEEAHLTGWLAAHFRPARLLDGRWVTPVAADGKGFPDLVLVHAGLRQILFRELKSDSGTLSPDQRKWLRAIHVAGGNADVWRPSDRTAINQILQTGEAFP